MTFIEAVVSALNRAEVRYVVVGGVAAVLHGYARLTIDLDLVVDLTPVQARKAIVVLTELGLVPLVPVDPLAFADPTIRESWVRDRNMRVFTLHDPSNPTRIVDLFVEPPVDFDELMARSEVVALSASTARIAGIPDLIRMKRKAGRPKDLLDIDALEAIEIRRKHGRA